MIQAILRKHIIKAVAVLILCTVGFFVAVYAGRLVEIRKNRVITAKNQLAAYEENKKIFTEESIQIADIKKRIASLEALQVTPDTVSNLLSSIEELAKSHHVELDITSVDTPGEGKARKLLMTLSVKGSFADVDAFAKTLNAQSYQIQFTKYQLFVEQEVQQPTPPNTPKQIAPKTPPQLWSLTMSIQVVSF